MWLSFLLTFLLMCQAACGDDDVSDVPEERREGSRLTGRMDRLERMFVDKMAAYNSEMEDLRRQVEGRDRQISSLTDKMAVYDSEMEDLKRQVEGRDRKISSLTDKMAAYDSEMEDLRRQLNDKDRQISSLTDKMAAFELRSQKQEEDVGELRRELRDKENQIAALETRYDSDMSLVKGQLNATNVEVATLQHRIQHLEQTVVPLEAALRRMYSAWFQQTARNSGPTSQDGEFGKHEDVSYLDSVNPNQGDNVLSAEESERGEGSEKRSDDGGPLEVVVSQLSQQVTQMSADVQTLKNSDLQQAQSIQNAQTSTFVRWGNSQCPSTSDLVYSGVIGSSAFDQTSGGANYLCLTMSPVFSSGNYFGAHLYGTEYETGDSHQDKDAVCAVCRPSFATTIMIPGTNVCTQGWHTQYTGYLMSTNYGQDKSEWICVDSALESTIHGNNNDNGALLYYTGTYCGSLPCDPYVNNKIVLCAVCSK